MGYAQLLERVAVETDAPVYAPGFDRTLEQPLAAALVVLPSARLVDHRGQLPAAGPPGVAASTPGDGPCVVRDQRGGLRVDRLVARHVEFGKSPDAAQAWVAGTDQRNADLVSPTAATADVVIVNSAGRLADIAVTTAAVCPRSRRILRDTRHYDERVPDSGGDSADPDLLIDFARVTLRRGGQVLVGPVTWSVELDERWVVIGPNGAGKTSLLRIAAAMEHPSSGTAYVLGERLGRTDMSELRSRVGLSSSALSQRVPDGELVRDLVVSAGYAVLGRWRERYDDVDYEQAIDMLESVGAEHLAERTYETLSEGERKRVLIARSLMTDPELLLLDEPAAGLDLGGREELVARLDDLAADPDAPAIVLVTHHVEEIPPGFSHALILSEGRVVDAGLLTDVLTAENLSKAFGQSIALEVIDGRYFARRTRSRAAHRRR